MNDLSLAEFAAWLHHTAELLGHYDARPVLDKLRGRLAQSVEENFARAQTPWRRPWPPLETPDHRPLVQTGDLELAAVESAWHSVTDDDTLAFAVDLLPGYWRFQQGGTSDIPPRPFLGFPDDFLDRASEALAEDVVEKMQAG